MLLVRCTWRQHKELRNANLTLLQLQIFLHAYRDGDWVKLQNPLWGQPARQETFKSGSATQVCSAAQTRPINRRVFYRITKSVKLVRRIPLPIDSNNPFHGKDCFTSWQSFIWSNRPCLLSNPKVHCHVRRNSSQDPSLSQLNPDNIHINIIIPSMSRFLKWSHPFRIS
jgi:hypothetical protein